MDPNQSPSEPQSAASLPVSPTPAVPAPPPPVDAPSNYISNPAGLLAPSYRAVLVNLKTLIISFLVPLGALLSGTAVIVILSVILHGRTSAIAFFILGAVFVIAAVIFSLRFTAIAPIIMLASARGQKITFKEAFAESSQYWPRIVGIYLLTGLATIGGYLLFIIPGFIFQAWFLLAPYVAIEENLGVVASMKRSKQLMQGRLLEMWGFEVFPQLSSFLQIIPFLGFILAILFQVAWMPAAAIRYEQLKQLAQTGAKPPIHWLNYVMVALAIVALPLFVLFSVMGSLQKAKDKQPSNVLEQVQLDNSK